MPHSPFVDLAALAARLPPRPLTRFAPSPTGFLHLGHLVNAIYVWGVARALGGRVLLRIEDHDRERSRPEFESAILADLEWLGLHYDAVDGAGSPRAGFVRQSERDAVYTEGLDRLRASDLLVYGCTCSRKALGAGARAGLEVRYPGTCRSRGVPLEPGVGVRVEIGPGPEPFDDARLGPQVQEPAAQCGDVLVRDRVGQWTYQFAVTVDDTEQQVDLVVRGEDLLASTGRQIRLGRVLGRVVPPVFLHHPLLYASSGHKLSKSNRDTGLEALRRAGVSAGEVLGLAARQAGLVTGPRTLSAASLPVLFE